MTHALKTWPENFAALLKGDRTFDVRKADRPFAVGDTVIFQEYDPTAKQYTGQEIKRRISHLAGNELHIKSNFLGLSLAIVDETGEPWGKPQFIAVPRGAGDEYNDGAPDALNGAIKTSEQGSS